MTVRITTFNPDGTLAVYHDEGGHGGTLPLRQVVPPQGPDGQGSARALHIPCPVAGCGATSTVPIGGGHDDSGLVQRLFARRMLAEAIRTQDPQLRTAAQVKARLKQLIVAAEGESRWRLEAVDDPTV